MNVEKTGKTLPSVCPVIDTEGSSRMEAALLFAYIMVELEEKGREVTRYPCELSPNISSYSL
jgi:hypothetical protein